VPGSPVGHAPPRVLLDAHFVGTRLDSQTLFSIWGGALTNGIPTLQAVSTQTGPLFDGIEGGLAHWGFTTAGPDTP
jgi:hypothetical protein